MRSIKTPWEKMARGCKLSNRSILNITRGRYGTFNRIGQLMMIVGSNVLSKLNKIDYNQGIMITHENIKTNEKAGNEDGKLMILALIIMIMITMIMLLICTEGTIACHIIMTLLLGELSVLIIYLWSSTPPGQRKTTTTELPVENCIQKGNNK